MIIIQLKLGDRNNDVKEASDFLVQSGYLKSPSNNYDADMSKAIRKLQKDLGLEETGEWDPLLINKKNSLDSYNESMKDRVQTIISSSETTSSLEDVLSILNSSAYRDESINKLKLNNDITIKNHPFRDRNLTWNTFIGACSRAGASLVDVLKMLRSVTSTNITLAEFENLLKNNISSQNSQPEYKSKQVALTSPRSDSRGSRTMRNSIAYAPISCYIVNLRTNTRIEFGLESPPTINDSKSANFSQQTPLSRSGPFYGYENSSARDISFDIELQADYCSEDIKVVVDKLRALVYPYIQGSLVYEPKCLVRIGDMIADLVCVCNSVSVSWEKPYKEGVYHRATVSLSFNEIEEVSKSQEVVEGGN